MKKLSLIALAATCFVFTAVAQAQPQDTIRVRASDPFGAGAIQSGDLARAEALLTSRHLESNDEHNRSSHSEHAESTSSGARLRLYSRAQRRPILPR